MDKGDYSPFAATPTPTPSATSSKAPPKSVVSTTEKTEEEVEDEEDGEPRNRKSTSRRITRQPSEMSAVDSSTVKPASSTQISKTTISKSTISKTSQDNKSSTSSGSSFKSSATRQTGRGSSTPAAQPAPQRTSQLYPCGNGIPGANPAYCPPRSNAFYAPLICLKDLEKQKKGISGNFASSGPAKEIEEDGSVNFGFRPRADYGTQVTFSVEPRKAPHWKNMMRCGFVPFINCGVAPAYLSPDPKGGKQLEQRDSSDSDSSGNSDSESESGESETADNESSDSESDSGDSGSSGSSSGEE